MISKTQPSNLEQITKNFLRANIPTRVQRRNTATHYRSPIMQTTECKRVQHSEVLLFGAAFFDDQFAARRIDCRIHGVYHNFLNNRFGQFMAKRSFFSLSTFGRFPSRLALLDGRFTVVNATLSCERNSSISTVDRFG